MPHHVAVIRVLQPVEEHVIEHLLVTHAIAGPCLRHQVRCVAHGLHATGDHNGGAAGDDQVMTQHGRFHA